MNSSADSRPVDLSDPALQWHSSATGLNLDSNCQAWLQAPGSLTQLLKQASAGEFRVEVLGEEWREIDLPGLRAEFGPLTPGHRFWSRRVLLLGKGQPWVQAHTLMPEHSLLSPLEQVLKLGNKPLGEFLFQHPDLLRSNHAIAHHSGQTWGRKGLYFLYGKPIMVAEFFLPALLSQSAPAITATA